MEINYKLNYLKFNTRKALKRQAEIKELMKTADPVTYNQLNAEYGSLDEGHAAVRYMKRVNEVIAEYGFECYMSGYKDRRNIPKIFQK